MKKNFLFLTTVMSILFLGACSKYMPFEENVIVPVKEAVVAKTITFSATFPEEDPTTRVTLEQDGKNIKTKWELNDKIEIAFVWQLGNLNILKDKSIGNVTAISSNGKIATFSAPVPLLLVGVLGTLTSLDMYGTYGGGGIGTNGGILGIGANHHLASLPKNTESATSLNSGANSIEARKDVMLYFAKRNISPLSITNGSNPNVDFNHLGSLFSIHVKNTSNYDLANVTAARLLGTPANYRWAYNVGAGGKIFNLIEESFKGANISSLQKSLSFSSPLTTLNLPALSTTTFWVWNAPLPNRNWPALAVQLMNGTSVLATSSTSTLKPARTVATPVGKTFHFYAEWNGKSLDFVGPF